MANFYMQKEDWDQAEKLLLEAFSLVKAIGEPPAFETVQLGQVAASRGDTQTALARYREGLTIFERLGMPRECQQVRAMIAKLENGGASQASDPMREAIEQANAAAQRGDLPAAIQAQEQAVALARQIEDPAVRVAMLVNLGQFYAGAERFDEAKACLAEALALGEQMRHPQLDVIRQIQANIDQLAALTPEERAARRQEVQEEAPQTPEDALEARIQAQLAGLPQDQRAEAEAQMRRAIAEFQSKSPEEQAAIAAAARRAQVDEAAIKARDAALAYARGQAPLRAVMDYIRQMGAQAAEGEAPGSPWLDAAALCAALAALLEGGTLAPVPETYAAHVAAVRSALEEKA
jgi:tetratricopeptide (TPR) repeat protein